MYYAEKRKRAATTVVDTRPHESSLSQSWKQMDSADKALEAAVSSVSLPASGVEYINTFPFPSAMELPSPFTRTDVTNISAALSLPSVAGGNGDVGNIISGKVGEYLSQSLAQCDVSASSVAPSAPPDSAFSSMMTGPFSTAGDVKPPLTRKILINGGKGSTVEQCYGGYICERCEQ